ncbi:MAG: integrase core domain-containing protein [Thermomicrobia bacterium]|nr:integrase core domain-containing protein [Thermomicrobia bacterium]
MSQSTRSSRAALKAVGSGSSVTLFSALPVPVRQLPHPHRLSKGAKRRLKWLDYRKTHTVTQTCRHFDIPRSTLNRWAKRCDPHNLASREDRSSRPRTVRHRSWGTREVAAVLALRTQYPRWGKAKLTALLTRQGLSLSVAMGGRILRSLRQRRLLVAPRPARATPRARHARPHAQRKPTGVTIPKERPGDLVQIDTMRLSPLPGVVRSHFSAIDCASRFGVVGIRSTATAGAAKAFLTEVRARCPCAIKAIPIDGGSEFMAEFEAECADEGILLWVLPPHSPKLNGQVERMNRTFREEWWEGYEGETDVPNMQEAGREGETVYNAIRPHQALGMRTPTEFLADAFGIHA